MKFSELQLLLSAGESSTVEYKRKINNPEKLAKEICAFANTKGGVIIIGVDDDGSIKGLKSEKSELDIVEKACGFYIIPELKAEVQLFDIQGKDLLAVIIKEGTHKPYKAMSHIEDDKVVYQVFIRVGESSVPASSEMSRLLKSQASDKPLRLSIGDKEKRLFQYLEKYNRATVKEFAGLVNISKRRAEQLLIRLVRAGVLQINSDTHHDYFTLI